MVASAFRAAFSCFRAITSGLPPSTSLLEISMFPD